MICLEEFKPSDPVRIMPECSHVFHSKCIEEWMEKETENLRQQSLSDPNTRIQIKCALCGVQIRT